MSRTLPRAAIVAPLRTPIGVFGGARYGLETLCIGGGQGIAAIFERA